MTWVFIHPEKRTFQVHSVIQTKNLNLSWRCTFEGRVLTFTHPQQRQDNFKFFVWIIPEFNLASCSNPLIRHLWNLFQSVPTTLVSNVPFPLRASHTMDLQLNVLRPTHGSCSSGNLLKWKMVLTETTRVTGNYKKSQTIDFYQIKSFDFLREKNYLGLFGAPLLFLAHVTKVHLRGWISIRVNSRIIRLRWPSFFYYWIKLFFSKYTS